MVARAATITERRLGCELEVAVPIIGRGDTRDVQDLLARVLVSQGVPSYVRAYSQAPIPEGYDLSIEHDSSLRGEQRYPGLAWAQIEVKTRPMTFTDVQRILPPTLDVIRYMGARVTTSCGLHVHHDLPEVVSHPQVVRNLMHFWWRYHKVLYGLVAPSRATSSYCRPPQPHEAKIFDACRTYQQICQRLPRCDRHWGLNVTNLGAGGRRTIEWRLHHGTTDYWPKICNWILATQNWTQYSIARSCQYRPQPIPNSQAGLNSLLISTGLKPNSRIYPKVDKELRAVGRYLLRRWKHFNQPPGHE